ncbi:MAG: hypothetical protein EXR43_05880 [Dehalococcoidia bacterium]|nr:hypothetical protein [Dehalococcoidia bacterium]
MTCDEARDLIDAYGLGALEVEDNRQLEAHLRTCIAECPQILADARKVALALTVPLRQSAGTLPARVMAAAAASPAGQGEIARPAAMTPALHRRRGILPMRFLAIAAGVTVLTVGIGGASLSVVTQGRLHDVEQRNDAHLGEIERVRAERAAADQGSTVATLSSRLAQQQTALVVMSAPDTQSVKLEGFGLAAETTAYSYWSRSASMGVLVGSKLPEAPAGQEYQMWVNRGTRTADAGKFTVGTDQTTMALVRLSGSEPFAGMNVTLPGTGRVLATASYDP